PTFEGFPAFDGDKMKKFITWVANEDKSKILAMWGIERGAQILSTPKLDAGDIKRLIHMNVTKGDIEFAEISKISGGMRPAKKGEEEGVRWFDGKTSGIRIMNGLGDRAKHACQREDYVKILRDGHLRDKDGKPKKKWVDPNHPCWFSTNMRYPIDMILEEGDLDEEKHATAMIGYWFKDAKEAAVASDVGKALMLIINEIGMNKPDSAYIDSPLWQDVVNKAKVAYDVLMEEEDLDELLRQEKERKAD
ncbi:hypothetical protein AWC38_SpisGene25548, partial [Stylophora pistillata]